MRWPLIRYIPRSTHFRFVRWAPVAAVLSAILIVGAIASLFLQGLNLGIDFKGGNALEIAMSRPVPLAELRVAMGQIGAHDAQVQGFGKPESALLRFKTEDGVDTAKANAAIKAKLAERFPGIIFTRDETVGSKISGELFKSGFIALAVAIFMMLLYIWFRFQLQFGLGAVIAIFHDVILTLGLLAVTQVEFSMISIAALLTVIGYSMNEKVITFDRLRENLRKFKKTPLRDVINLSENERLSRTLITGTTALLALAGMLFLGGPALRPLIMTMVFGIVIGTYSSIYVALPVILLWGVKKNDDPATPAKAAPAR